MNRAKLTGEFQFIGDRLGVRPMFGVSTRQLTARYSGPCMTVRRSSDSAERDIFFAGGLLDLAAIRNFAVGGSCYVKTWYDQFTGAGHPTQATAGSQPRILNAGVAETVGSNQQRAAVRGFGSQYLRTNTPPFGASSEFTASIVSCERVNSNGVAFSLENTNRIDAGIPYGTLVLFDFGGTSGANRILGIGTWPVALNKPAVVTVRNSVADNTKYMRVNGSQLLSGTGTSSTLTKVEIFANETGDISNAGLGELLVFSSALGLGDVSTLEKNQLAFYGV